MSVSAFEKEYKREQIKIDNKLSVLFNKSEPKSLYDPCAYILSNGGKRLRPLLVLMAAKAVGAKYAQVYNAALSVEILHNFTLVHDDIMDNSNLRRGKKTVHIKYDEDTAILAGDNLIGVAFKVLLKDCKNNTNEVVGSFTKAIIEVCEGQSYDKNFETTKNISVDDYLLMISKKTAALLVACCEIGALLGNGTKKEVNALKKYAHNLGMAFQFQDDLLDIMGNEKKFGKPIGADLLEGKKTFLFLKALERAKGKEKKELQKVIKEKGTTKDKIDYFRNMYINLGVIEATEKEIEVYTRKALNALKNLDNEGSVNQLTWLANSLLKRNN